MSIASGTMIGHAEREEWLATRRNSIGGSEAAAAIGVSPWQTPLELYLDKLGLAAPIVETEAMAWGTRLEPLIAEEYQRRSGHGFVAEQLFVRSPVHGFMSATLDRVRDDGRVVEFKTVGHHSAHHWGESGTDEVPRHYLCQVLHQLVVTGTDVADVAVLIAGQEFRTYTISRDDDVTSRIIEREAAFWDRVQRRDPPPVDPDRDGPALARLWPRAEGEVELDAVGHVLVESWQEHGREIHRHEEARERCKTRLLEILEDAASARLADGRSLTRRVIRVAEQQVTRRAHEYVDLRIKTPKGY